MKKSLVSGMRPTGKLHIGHYMGVLRNWVSLQNSDKYDCFFFVADWHALTTGYSHNSELQSNTLEVVKDFLGCGLNPDKSTIYTQSAIPEIAQLHLLLSMITPHNWVERDPTLKDLIRAAESNSISELSYGMLGYPVLQTADILLFRGGKVPVGKDQVAHLEISRQIARRFNKLFDCDFFAEPEALLTDTHTLAGTDGQKMSKSYNNDLKISHNEAQTTTQCKKMITDPQRIKRSDPGNTEQCQVVFPYYKIFADEEMLNTVKDECHNAKIGCLDCKTRLAKQINNFFSSIRRQREDISDQQAQKVLEQGNQIAREHAQNNLRQIKEIMKLNDF